jgi:hypothetical protein
MFIFMLRASCCCLMIWTKIWIFGLIFWGRPYVKCYITPVPSVRDGRLRPWYVGITYWQQHRRRSVANRRFLLPLSCEVSNNWTCHSSRRNKFLILSLLAAVYGRKHATRETDCRRKCSCTRADVVKVSCREIMSPVTYRLALKRRRSDRDDLIRNGGSAVRRHDML